VIGSVPVRFRFDGELNFFPGPERRNSEFTAPIGPTDTVKHAIESLGIPHTEIGRISINGEEAVWSRQPREYCFAPSDPQEQIFLRCRIGLSCSHFHTAT